MEYTRYVIPELSIHCSLTHTLQTALSIIFYFKWLHASQFRRLMSSHDSITRNCIHIPYTHRIPQGGRTPFWYGNTVTLAEASRGPWTIKRAYAYIDQTPANTQCEIFILPIVTAPGQNWLGNTRHYSHSVAKCLFSTLCSYPSWARVSAVLTLNMYPGIVNLSGLSKGPQLNAHNYWFCHG